MPRLIRRLGVVRRMVIVGVICAASAARAQGNWVKLAPFPEPAEEISGACGGWQNVRVRGPRAGVEARRHGLRI